MADQDPLHALHAVVHSYLGTLMAVADCVGEACPPVGSPYRQRLSRLRTRLTFDANKDAVQQSAATVRAELKEYSAKAAQYLERNKSELRRAASGLEGIARTLTQRQEFYASRLRQFASQMESTRYPADPEHLKDVVQMQAEGLMACVDSMTHESQSLLARMQSLLSDVEQKLAETEITDVLTGLMNRREMERRIEDQWLSGNAVTQLMYRVSCPSEGERRDEVFQQAASRLAAQSRHNDLVSRWSENEFLVLFQGPAETANKRGAQIAQLISGPYALASGETVDVIADFEVMEHAPTTPR
jgi:GGDEF domain-containing protein